MQHFFRKKCSIVVCSSRRSYGEKLDSSEESAGAAGTIVNMTPTAENFHEVLFCIDRRGQENSIAARLRDVLPRLSEFRGTASGVWR